MKLAVEHLTRDVFSEIAPLGQEAWDECSEIKKDTCSFHGERGFRIQPDVETYLLQASRDSLLAFTLRDDDGALQGYALTILYRSLHHQPVKCAGVDTFYIRPAHRIKMRSMIELMEENFREREIVVVGWPVSPMGGLYELLCKLGYAPDDVVMEKRICALPQE